MSYDIFIIIITSGIMSTKKIEGNKLIMGKSRLKKCEYCFQEVTAAFYDLHLDSHPSKILDWLYLGSYNNALNKKVRWLIFNMWL